MGLVGGLQMYGVRIRVPNTSLVTGTSLRCVRHATRTIAERNSVNPDGTLWADMLYPNLFKNKYPELRGKDWIRHIEPDDRQVFIEIGMKAWDYGRVGGLARARTARRDSRGRFAKTTTDRSA